MNNSQLIKKVTGYIKGGHPDVLVVQMPDDILLDIMVYTPKVNLMPAQGVIIPTLKYHGLAICIKEPDKRPTEDQWSNIEKLINSQWAVQVCYSYKEAQEIVDGYLGKINVLN